MAFGAQNFSGLSRNARLVFPLFSEQLQKCLTCIGQNNATLLIGHLSIHDANKCNSFSPFTAKSTQVYKWKQISNFILRNSQNMRNKMGIQEQNIFRSVEQKQTDHGQHLMSEMPNSHIWDFNLMTRKFPIKCENKKQLRSLRGLGIQKL